MRELGADIHARAAGGALCCVDALLTRTHGAER